MTLSNVDENTVTKVLWAAIKPRYYVAHSVHSGNVRVVSTTEFVTGIEFDRTESITAVRQTSLAACDANGKWYWDRDAGKVYFYYDGSDAYIVLVLGIFLNTNVDRLQIANFDGDAFGDLTVYDGRLQETSFLQSCEDILTGKLGVYSTNISVINNDSKYNPYATDSISFKNASVKIWLSIDDIDNRIVVFNGLCESASFGSNMNLSIVELTKAMQQEATFGDSRSWLTINATRWPDSKEEDRYKIIPMILSNTTRKTGSKTKNAFYVLGDPPSIIKYYSYFDVDPSIDLKIKYAGIYEPPFIFEDGKKHIVCRCVTDEFPQNFHRFVDKSTTPVLINNIDDSDISLKQYITGSYGEFSVNATSTSINLIDFLYAGMLVYMRDLTSGTYHEMIVTFVDTTNKKFGLRFFIGNNGVANIIVAGHSYQLHYWGPTVYTVVDGIPVYLLPSQYYFIQETTDGGNVIIYCVINTVLGTGSYFYLGNLMEGWRLYKDDGSLWNPEEVPDLDYYCRFFNFKFKIVADRSTMNIAKVINYATRKIPEITTDSTSNEIVAGNSFYDYQTKIGQYRYIDVYSPEPESVVNETYIDVIEKCLASTMAYMSMKTDGKLILRLFENQPYDSVALSLTEDDIALGSVVSNIDFSEIASAIDASPEFSQDTGVFSESEKVRRTSGEIKFNFKHFLKSSADYSAIVKDRLESYKLFPIKRYSFTIINKGYELTLGDRINLSFTDSGKWLGSDTTKELFVIKINKALSGVQVDCIENIFASN